MWGRIPPSIADTTFIQEGESEDVSVPREAHEPSAHIRCIHAAAALIPLPLTHPQPSTALVPSQKRLCQTAGH